MDTSLMGQVALVTGGGRGIGRAIAHGLAAEGAAVVVTARSPDQLDETVSTIKAAGGLALAVPADITDVGAVNRVVESAEQSFGPVDLLINNAGVAGPAGPVWQQDAEDWRRTLEINVYGQFLVTKVVLQGMVARRRGRIINVSSGAGYFRGGFAGFSAYAASKAALSRLTETLAVETREHGISVFALSPGVVRTEMLKRAFDSAAADLAPGRAERMLESAVPVEMPVQLCLVMASGRADKLSGTVLSVHDDLDELLRLADEVNDRDLYRLRLATLDS
jgi:NAD(P)-dependent dehydrogenase (short-subunit alcohol dehydrogenase family)